jgi:hypothetical protein
MNDTEKALVIINTLPNESLSEFLLISAISPFNTDKGYKLSPKGRALLRGILETKVTSMEMISMTNTDAAVLEGTASLLRLYKATYDILENLDQPYKNSEELAKFDEEFFQSLEKMPIIKEIIKYLAKEFKTA